jgi:RNA polymerase sigma-70 factor (ECF subfamily)
MARHEGGSGPGEVPDDEILRLVQRARAGDRDAFGLLIGHFEVQALSVSLRVVRDPDEARDVVQEAFLRALRYLASYRPERPFRTWLMRIVMNEALDRRRARRARATDSLAPDAEGPAVGPAQEEGLAAAEAHEAVEGLLAALTPRERAAFVLRDVEGWPTRDVADALGCREGTVRRHVSLARQRLRDLLRRRHPDLWKSSRKD